MCRKWKENGTIKYVGAEDKLTNNKTKTKEKNTRLCFVFMTFNK